MNLFDTIATWEECVNCMSGRHSNHYHSPFYPIDFELAEALADGEIASTTLSAD